MASSSRASWAALVLELPARVEDEVAGLLGDRSLGVQIVPVGTDRSRLRIFVATESEARALLSEAASILDTWELTPERCAARIEPVEDEAWAQRYQANLKPFPLGSRFTVVPHGEAYEEPGRVSIHLVPGRAFGTGEHATTRLAAEALERHVKAGERWLDLGTGTAILALVAAHCGAGSVEALDNDPDAVDVANEVLARNASRRITVALGSASDRRNAGFDGIVANIASSYFLASATDVSAALRPGGTLLATGFLLHDATEMKETLLRAGLEVVDEHSSGEWLLLVARRKQKE